MLMCVESMDVEGGCNAVAIEHGRYSLSCMQKQCGAVLDMYGMHVGSFKSCCEILLLLNVAESDMDCLLCGRLWSEQC